jgi:hypothetical protein
VEDDADWDELLDSKYWSRGVQEMGATFFVGKRIHIMLHGNYRGTIEVTKITLGPAPDAHIVEVKKIA